MQMRWHIDENLIFIVAIQQCWLFYMYCNNLIFAAYFDFVYLMSHGKKLIWMYALYIQQQLHAAAEGSKQTFTECEY